MPEKIEALWLYRVLENDEDGDPLDFGAVRGRTMADAGQAVRMHLREDLQWPGWNEVPIRLHGLRDLAEGVLPSVGRLTDI